MGAIVPLAILVLWHWASTVTVVVPSIARVADVLGHPLRRPADLDATSLADGLTVSVLRVTLDDLVEADRMFTILMGDQVEPRRKFIEEYADSVRNLDV